MQFDSSERRQLLVTGGTSGIGLALAVGFAEAGWDVVAAGLRSDEVALRQVNERIRVVELDVTDSVAIDRVVAECPRIDALINAAGIIQRIDEFKQPVFERVVDVNLHGTMRVCTACKNKLAKSGGSIVNIASMLTFFGGGLVPAYAASKGAIGQLTKSLAIAWAADRVRVNAIVPGWIETPLTVDLRNDKERNKSIVSRTPMARWGKPEELVGPALFLTSDAASFVTGALLTVDGGYSIM